MTGQAAVRRDKAIAQLDHRTAAAQGRTIGGKPLIGCCTLAVKFVLVRKTRIDLLARILAVQEGESGSHAMRRNHIELVGFARIELCACTILP